ncbi:hypothetical protein [Pygmaiobacter massiliensis]|uniref:hypothetical protein n=1 Tax=Pygmaiobacter massiliensis TaxID=1917873 RepID=UPI0028A24300|nr:hypothetical protein [Pygmaiobacter massiliensis]
MNNKKRYKRKRDFFIVVVVLGVVVIGYLIMALSYFKSTFFGWTLLLPIGSLLILAREVYLYWKERKQ